jgi:cysteine desulfurase/selenocysteine lyase
VEGHDPRDVQRELAERRINVSVSMIEDTRLDMEARGYEEWVRSSVHYFNTHAEIQLLVDAVRDVAGRVTP